MSTRPHTILGKSSPWWETNIQQIVALSICLVLYWGRLCISLWVVVKLYWWVINTYCILAVRLEIRVMNSVRHTQGTCRQHHCTVCAWGVRIQCSGSHCILGYSDQGVMCPRIQWPGSHCILGYSAPGEVFCPGGSHCILGIQWPWVILYGSQSALWHRYLHWGGVLGTFKQLVSTRSREGPCVC